MNVRGGRFILNYVLRLYLSKAEGEGGQGTTLSTLASFHMGANLPVVSMVAVQHASNVAPQ